MRKLLITMVLFISTAVMGVDVMRLAPSTFPMSVLPNGQMLAQVAQLNYNTCSIAARATVGTVDTAAAEDHWLIWMFNGAFYFESIAPVPPVGVPGVADSGWVGTGHGNVHYFLRDNSNAIQAQGTLRYNGQRDEFAKLFIRVGLKAAAPASLTTGTTEQPIWHLDKANYDGASITVQISGNYKGDVGKGNRLSLMQIHNDGFFAPTYVPASVSVGTNTHPESRISGNGMVETKITISIPDDTEELCDHIGV